MYYFAYCIGDVFFEVYSKVFACLAKCEVQACLPNTFLAAKELMPPDSQQEPQADGRLTKGSDYFSYITEPN